MTTEITEYQPTENALTTPAAGNAGTLISGSLALLDGSYRLAQTLVQTNFAPPHFRGKAEEGAVAIMYGAQLGLDPLQSFQNITVISGRPGLYARTMHALVVRAGHRVTITETGPDRVVVSGQRKGSPDVETAEWTIERARRAGYTSNKKYETEPEAMLRARALADVCRVIAPDVLLGLSYAAEELEVIDEPADVTPLPKEARPKRESAAALIEPPAPRPAPAVVPAAVVETPAEPAPVVAPAPEPEPTPIEGEELATPAQQRAVHAAMRSQGYTDKAEILQVVSDMVKRPIGSAKELTKAEASTVLDAIKAEANTAPTPEAQAKPAPAEDGDPTFPATA